MKQTMKASLTIPVFLKNQIKQQASVRNLFISEYLARLLLRDLGSPQPTPDKVESVL